MAPYGGKQWRFRARKWYKKGSKSSIKPVSVSKTAMQKATAKNQQKQIITNSKAISGIVKAYNKNIVYTDYQLSSSDALNINDWVNEPLTNVAFWQPVMRRSIAIQNTKMTTCIKMHLTIRVDMGTLITSSVFWNVFLIRPRKQGAGQVTTPLLLNLDYVEMTGYAGRYIQLNPGKYEVLREWHDQLLTYAANDIVTPLSQGSLVGNPNTTYKEHQVVLPMNMEIRMPDSEPWVDKQYLDLPYFDQISLLIYPQCDDPNDLQKPRFFYNALFTCVNHL